MYSWPSYSIYALCKDAKKGAKSPILISCYTSCMFNSICFWKPLSFRIPKESSTQESVALKPSLIQVLTLAKDTVKVLRVECIRK